MSKDIENITNKSEDVGNEDVYALPEIKKRKSFFRKLFKFLFFFASAIVVLLIILILFIQTSYFKNWALNYTIGKLNESLASKETVISASSIEGSILKDLSLYNVSVVTKKDTLLKFDRIELDYNIFGIFRKRIFVNDCIIFRPQLNLTKVRDKNDSLIWNFAYVLKPEKPEIDTTKKEFDWYIELNNLVIFRCQFRMLENKNSDLPIREVQMPFINSLDMSTLDVKDLNLNLSAYYSPDEKIVNVKSINFKSNSPVNINSMSFDAYVDKRDRAGIRNMNLETDKSRVRINEIRVEDFNPFKNKLVYKQFKDKQLYADIVTNYFDAEDIKFFVKDVNFLGGKVYMDLKTKGSYGNLYLNKLELNTGKSNMDITGRVINLNEPDKLNLDVNLKNGEFDPQDTKIMLPGLKIPDFPNVGKVYADIIFKGEPRKFDSDFDVRTSAGDFKGKTFIDVTSGTVIYKSDFTMKNFDASKVLKDENFKSNINATIIADGRGIDYKTMVNKINYEITNSSVFGQNISKSGGVINSNNGSFDINLDYASNSLNTKVQGTVDIKDFSNIKYNVKGTVQNLDVSSFTKNTGMKSNLNFDFDCNGVGYDPDKIVGNLQFNMSPSTFSDFVIPRSPITAKFETSGNTRNIKINSNFIDLDATGNFEFKTIPEIIMSNTNVIINQIKRQYNTDTLFLDKNKTFTIDDKLLTSKSESVLPNMHMIYKVNIKDLTPIIKYTSDSTFTFNANLQGEIKNDVNSFIVKVSGEVNNFRYGDSSIRFTKGLLNFDFMKGYYPYNEGFFHSNLDFKTNQFSKGRVRLDTISLTLNADENQNKFFLFGMVDTNKFVATAGSIAVGGKVVLFSLDTLFYRYFDNKLSNRERLQFAYKPGDIEDTLRLLRFDNFRVISNDDQRISIKGTYAFNDTSNLNLGLYRIKVSDIQMFAFPEIEEDNLIKGNIRRLRLTYSGTIENPHLYVEANTEVLSLQKFKLGRLDAIIDYKENMAKPEISFYNPNNEGKLIITGEVPFRNLLNPTTEGDQRLDFLQNEVDLNVLAKNFQIRILEQIIPVISGLNGNLDGSIDIKGIVKKPLLSGTLNVKNGSFKVNMTGTRYNFLANLTTKDQSLIFQNVKMYFPDEPDKKLTVHGYLDLSNLEMNDLELTMDGEIKVFDKEVAKNILGVYGDLYGKTGTPPLTVKANSERMDLTGNLILTEGRIYIPPFKKDAYNLYSDNYVYKILYDSSSFTNGNLSAYISKMQDSVKTLDKKRLNPFDMNYIKKNVETVTEEKKHNYFHYDIKIITQDKIFTNLVIDDKTAQEFFGNVSTTLYFDNKEKDSLSVHGTVELGDNAIYKFYKNFKASGSVQFTGSMVNPELHIDGEYDASSRDPNDPNVFREVVILLNVRGDVAKPDLRWKVLVNGVPIGGSDPTDEAISFIVFGKFKDELSAEQRINLVSTVGVNVGSTFASSYLTNTLQNYIPFLVNTDINYVDNQSGNLAQNTDIRFTAEIGYATIRFGGQLFKDLSNTNFTLEYPINKLWKFNSLSNNLIFQFERVVDPYSENSTTISGSSRTGALIFYRIKF